MEKRVSAWHIGLVVLLFATSCLLAQKTQLENQKQYMIPPPEHVEYFHFGFADMIADSLWLRWIQDADTCQTYAGAAPAKPIAASTGEFANPRHKFCDNSWSYKMLDSITLLAPKFRMPYLTGAITLSVLVEDYEGAKKIFERGIDNFPDDWTLLYRAAYHYLFDRQDLPTAAALLVRAQKSPDAPYWLGLLAAKLYSRSGQLEMGLVTLENYRKVMTDPKQIADIDRRIAALKEKMKQ